MNKLIAQRHLIRQNWLAIVGVCLFCYFSYHALLGERSYIRLMSIERQIDKLSVVYNDLHDERMALEDKVIRLRPATLDRDLLEERAYYVLGYYRPNEAVIIP